MAVEITGTSASFVGTGVSSSYAPAFYINDSSQMKVYVDGVLKTLGADYTVNGVGASAGCTIVATFASGSDVYIERDTPITQLVDTVNNETVLEDVLDGEFDKLTMIAQELNGKTNRAIVVPKGEAGYTLPAAASRANLYLVFDNDGDLVLSSGTGADAGLRADLASTAADRGSALVANVTSAANIVSHGAQGTTSAAGFDSTTAILAAIATGKNVYVPPLTDPAAFYRVTAALPLQSGQVIFGAGVRSMIRQTTANLNVIVLAACTGSKVENLGVWASGTKTSFSDGMGVAITGGSTQCEVRGCTIKNHLGWGVGIMNSNENKVLCNWLIESPATDAMKHDEVGGDICIFYSSSNNLVFGNHCISGNGVGIGIQTIVDGDSCDGNQILFNNVRDARQYSIMAYRNAQTAPSIPLQSVFSTVIVGNRLRNTTGAVAHRVDGYVYGSAVYVQGAEGTTVSSNNIVGTHTAPVAFIEQLAPGAIGATNLSQIDVLDNTIANAGFFSIYVADPNNFGLATGFANISGNNIKSAVKDAIKIARRGRVSICNNEIDTPQQRGIYVANIAQKELISIRDNDIRNPTLSGMEIAYVTELTVCDNTVKGSGLHSIYIDNSTDVVVNDNMLKDHAARGMHITSTCVRAVAQNNHIRSTGAAGTVGMQLDANGIYWPNFVTNHVTDFSGTWKDMRTLAVNSATPSVLYGHAFVTANTGATTITNLLDGYDGQEIVIVIRDAFTTIDFTATSLKGNGGVDWVAPINGSMRCVYNRALAGWFCTVQGG